MVDFELAQRASAAASETSTWVMHFVEEHMTRRRSQRFLRLVPWWLGSLIVAGCGGGGGDDGKPIPPPGDVSIGTSNQASVARAAAAAIEGGLVSGSLGLTDATPVGVSGIRSLVLRVARGGVVASATSRERAASLVDLGMPCDVSGSIAVTLDDRDNSLSVTPGDVLNATYDNCRNADSDAVINGSMSATYTQAVRSPLTVAADVSLAGLRSSSALSARSVTYNGGFALSYVETSASKSTTRITVNGELAAQAVHPLYQDTITAQAGYVVTLYADLATPPGATSGGRTIIEAGGKVRSAGAGGVFNVWSQPPGLDHWDVEPYPRSGQVLLQGKTGQLMLTVLSASSVRMELDADGDSAYESSQDVAWDWLI